MNKKIPPKAPLLHCSRWFMRVVYVKGKTEKCQKTYWLRKASFPFTFSTPSRFQPRTGAKLSSPELLPCSPVFQSPPLNTKSAFLPICQELLYVISIFFGTWDRAVCIFYCCCCCLFASLNLCRMYRTKQNSIMNPHVSLTHSPQTINPGPISCHLHLHPLLHTYIILQQIPRVIYVQLYPGLNNSTIIKIE